MQALAEERARVMVVGDPARLRSLDLQGSSAWRADLRSCSGSQPQASATRGW